MRTLGLFIATGQKLNLSVAGFAVKLKNRHADSLKLSGAQPKQDRQACQRQVQITAAVVQAQLGYKPDVRPRF